MSTFDDVKAWVGSLAQRGVRFEPALDEPVVAAAEASLGITFPDELRRYLREIASGYEHSTFTIALRRAQREGKASQPFPFTTADAARALSSKTPLPGPVDGSGTFLVWDHGCGEESHLVVTGEERGRVWRCFDAGWLPEHEMGSNDAQPFGYLDWLKWWSTVW